MSDKIKVFNFFKIFNFLNLPEGFTKDHCQDLRKI